MSKFEFGICEQVGIRESVMQAAGENLMAVVPAFARQLAAGAADHPRGLPRASAYMDFLSFFMVGCPL